MNTIIKNKMIQKIVEPTTLSTCDMRDGKGSCCTNNQDGMKESKNSNKRICETNKWFSLNVVTINHSNGFFLIKNSFM